MAFPPSTARPANAAAQRPPRLLSGISEIAGSYDAFILDLWGVIHNGVSAYPGALDCLERLREAGKRTALLSNAPRRTEPIIRQLVALGIRRELFGGLVSSGELVHEELESRRDPWIAALGRACFHVGPERDHSVWRGLDLEMVDEVGKASFVLNTGPWRDDAKVGDFEDLLRQAAARKLPMICANPDIEVIRGERRMICAGAIARRYEELGGDVRYYGKPYPAAYRRCLDLLGVADRTRVVAIGDSLRTDIAGARAAGIDSVLVVGGLHAEEMGLGPDELPEMARLGEICAAAGHIPMAALARFTW